MTQSDRGAYPPERPLAFDRYAERPRGGPAPVALILSVLVLLGVSGGVFYLYRGGARAPGGPPEPVGAPVGDLKIAAPPQVQTPDPAAGLTIYKDNPNAVPAAPAFTAPPEQPAPRPTDAAAPSSVLYPVSPAPPATTATVAAAAPPARVSPKIAVAAAAVAAEKPAAKHVKPPTIDTLLADATPTPKAKHSTTADADSPAAKAKAKHALVLADAAPLAAKHAGADATPTPKHAAVSPEATPNGKHAGGFAVQIGAFSSQALADKSWNSVAGIVPGSMAGKGKKVASVTKADGKTLYRTAITGFDSRADAQAMCAKLSAAGRTCFVR